MEAKVLIFSSSSSSVGIGTALVTCFLMHLMDLPLLLAQHFCLVLTAVSRSVYIFEVCDTNCMLFYVPKHFLRGDICQSICMS